MRINNKNSCQITLQKVTKQSKIPSRYCFQRWVNAVCFEQKRTGEITIRLVGVKESAKLNQDYRRKTGPTNILSFPFEPPANIKIPILGDLVICAPLVAKEAKQQNKPWLAHWAHLVTHGVLHLFGYDHIKKKDAKLMENLEINILAKLGFENPYSE